MTEYDIGAAFEAIEDELISSMIRNMKRHRVEEADNEKQWEMWQAKQLESLEEYKRKNRKKYKGTFTDINDSIDKVIRKAYQEGGMEQEIEILKSIKKKYGDNVPNRVKRIRDSILSKTPFGSKAKRDYFQVNDKKLDALIHATTSDMTKAESAMLRMADDQYRKIIFNAQVYANSGAGTYEQAVDMATKDFLSAGINCIEYKDGRRVNIKSYARMAIRTADKRAALYADGELRKKLGISTVITKKRMNACPKCLPFVDKILVDDVWSGGKPEDGPYPLLSKALEAGFLHPSCKDHVSTYIPGITEPPEGSFTKDEVKKVEKAAEQEAKQKYAERQAEKFERLAKHSLDDKNREKYQQKTDEWENTKNLLISESADIENLRKGNNAVDLAEIKSHTFGKKFNKITENSAVNDALRKYARTMLVHRNGTDGEDLYVISSKTGKRIFSKTKGTNMLGVVLTAEEISMLKEYAKTEGIIGIHNHPTNLYPTGSDFVTAGARGYDFGMVVTHDGRVFQYKPGNKPFRSEYFNKTVDKYVSEPYNYDISEAQLKALYDFGKEFGIEWKELI